MKRWLLRVLLGAAPKGRGVDQPATPTSLAGCLILCVTIFAIAAAIVYCFLTWVSSGDLTLVRMLIILLFLVIVLVKGSSWLLRRMEKARQFAAGHAEQSIQRREAEAAANTTRDRLLSPAQAPTDVDPASLLRRPQEEEPDREALLRRADRPDQGEPGP